MTEKKSDRTRAPNGASTVYYSEYDHLWHGRVTVGIRDDGRPDRRHIKRKSESAVQSEVRKIERARDNGKVRKPALRSEPGTAGARVRHAEAELS